MTRKSRYVNRDISWLSFNARILEEAGDPDVPLYERIKFMAIWSSNLDEFFRVRVASLQSLQKIRKKKLKKELDFKPKKTLKKVLKIAEKQQLVYGRVLTGSILPELRNNNILLHWNHKLTATQKNKFHNYFRSRVLSFLQPVMIEEANKKKLFLENRALYLVVKLKNPVAGNDTDISHAFLNIPSGSLPRFVTFYSRKKHHIIFIDDLIKANLDIIFPGFEIVEYYSIKLNRDADLNIDDEFSGDLIEKIKKHLSYRRINIPSRFLYDKRMPEDMLGMLIDQFDLHSSQIVKGGIYHNLNDLSQLPNPEDGKLAEKKMVPLKIDSLEIKTSIFHSLETRDFILHLPYHTYDYVLRFFNEAAIDPEVRQIKVTLYRVAENSLIANALISAARNGKKVIVFVEVKARFDEENNLYWADMMKKAGIKIIYSMPGLKVHAKIALVKRKDHDGKMKAFGFLGTGNFNEITAGIYADEGLFTAKKDLLKEMDMVFKFLEKGTPIKRFRYLLVSQFNILDSFKDLINREILHARSGKVGKIVLKMNNLEDREMIDKLYEANAAGVGITLIIRGICCLRPQTSGLSDNINVYRIVDSFLEHARVFIFNNDGEPDIYLGSADWMSRNLRHRIEVVFPVIEPEVREEILQMIELQINDNTKKRVLNENLVNNTGPDHLKPPLRRSQVDFYRYLKRRS